MLPSADELRRLSTLVLHAWPLAPPASPSLLMVVDDPDAVDVVEYFAGKRLQDVKLADRKVPGVSPFLFGLTTLGKHYYLAAFLLDALDFYRVRESGIGTPFIAMMYYLCDGAAKESGMPFSGDQVKAIRAVLEFVTLYPDTYSLDTFPPGLIEAGIDHWFSERASNSE